MNYYLEQITAAILQLSWVEIAAVVAGLIYVILAAKENIWCWFWGILNALLSVYLFYTYQLFAESILYIYYIFAGFYGWWAWSKNAKNQNIEISTWKVSYHLIALTTGILIALLLAFILKTFTAAQLPIIDSFTTIFSFIATFMVTRKVLENWIYWIAIDFVTIGLYFNRGLYLYSLLMVVYTIIAIVGFIEWRRQYKIQKVRSIN